jgi:hypothetical protein
MQESTMETKQKSLEDLAASTEKAAEKTMAQAQGVMDSYFDWLQKVMAGTPWGKTDLIAKWKTYTDQNIAASVDCMQKMSRAKDLQDVIHIQTEFIQTQMNALAKQMKDLGEAYFKAASGAESPPTRHH